MKSNDNIHHDINIMEMIDVLWKKKWSIVWITTVSVIISIIITITDNKKTYKTGLTVYPLSIEKEFEYERYNSKKPSQYELITGEYLLSLLTNKLQHNNYFTNVFLANNYFNINDFKNKAEYQIATSNFTQEIKVTREISKLGAEVIMIKHENVINIDKYAEVINLVLIKAQNDNRDYLRKYFDNMVAILSDEKKTRVQQLKIQISGIVNDYDKQIKYRLAFLEEQASLARANNSYSIDKPIKDFDPVIESNFMDSASIISDSYYFLRGYDIIIEEIRLIKNRAEVEPFIKGLQTRYNSIRLLETDLNLDRIQSALEQSPIFLDKKFQSVFYDIAGMETQSEYNRGPLLLIFGAIIGLFSSIIIILTNYNYKIYIASKHNKLLI